jgi:hypothetical protein
MYDQLPAFGPDMTDIRDFKAAAHWNLATMGFNPPFLPQPVYYLFIERISFSLR